MTIKELIEELSKYPQDLYVYSYRSDSDDEVREVNYKYNWGEIEGIILG